jgi:hypothetical protein
MKAFILAAATVLFSSTVAVAGSPVTETWTGTGSLYDAHRNLISRYQLEVNHSTADRSTAVRVTLADGSVREINCVSNGDELKWAKTCDNGMSGGGYYFERGIISDYVEDGAGTAQATTMIFDSDDSMRILRTQLVNGDANLFFVESLSRTSK